MPLHQPFSVYSAEHVADLISEVSGLSMSTDPGFPVAVNQRLQTAHVVADANAKSVDGTAISSSIRLVLASRSASSSRKAIFWLRKSADAFNQAYAAHAACRAGCNHCCHIPVSVSEPEARLIATETGLPLSLRRGHVSLEAGYDNPCPLLVNGQCSAYNSRPLACRIHVNLDQDDMLCHLLPGASVPVPYADKRFIAAEVVAQFKRTAFADIREWFSQ